MSIDHEVGQQRDRIRLGELVAKELERTRQRDQAALVEALSKEASERSTHPPATERIAADLSFLVRRDQEERFRSAVARVEGEAGGRLVVRAAGPLPPQELVQRSFAKNTALDYWESGMDLGLSRDMFDSFMHYQTTMQKTFRHLQTTYGFTIVDGMRSAEVISAELRKKISAVLAGK